MPIAATKGRRCAKQSATADAPHPARSGRPPAYGLLVTGIGGTGHRHIGGVLGWPRGSTISASPCSIRPGWRKRRRSNQPCTFCRRQHQLPPCIAAGDANAILGCDTVVAATNDCTAKIRRGRPVHAQINAYPSPTGEVLHNPICAFRRPSMEQTLTDAVGEEL